jgi:hypothetical protein
MSDPDEINTMNDHLVGVQGGKITMVLPPLAPMDVDEALRLAAWIVCVAVAHNPNAESDFARVLKAVQST